MLRTNPTSIETATLTSKNYQRKYKLIFTNIFVFILKSQGLIQCYLDLDNVNTAFNFAEGAIGKHPEYEGFLLEMQAEPLWRLGRYEDLNKLVENPYLAENSSWGVKLGQALLKIQNGEFS